jgi:spore coat polysaccharide biosynthesis protein SpsF
MAGEERFETPQERFWAGEAGSNYLDRNPYERQLATSAALFAQTFARVRPPKSALEIGANMGQNLVALQRLFPGIETTGLEINPDAQAKLATREGVEVLPMSVLEFEPDRTWDLVFTKGVLIHIAPERLPEVYDRLHRACGRYLWVGEYYSPRPEMVPYQGEEDRLFRRDFAGDLLDRFPDLYLRDYGFVYRRDPAFAQDDITWFLLERVGA